MFCTKCGREIEDGELFCGACGTPVDAAEEQNTEPAAGEGESRGAETAPHSDRKTPKKVITVVIVAAVILVIAGVFAAVYFSRFSATTMRLSRYDGKVTLTDKNGRDQDLREDRRLASGDVLDTGKESKVWVLLDEDRMVTIMERSSAEFYQSGKNLRLHLSEGSLFFNIERSLEDDETFNIETSTMVVGIRGTSGYVTTDEDGKEVLYLTSGKVEITGKNPESGEEESVKLSAGQKAVIILDDDDVEIRKEDITVWDLPEDAVLEICADDDLLDAVISATGWDEDDLKALEEMYLQGEDPEGVTDGAGIDLSNITEDDILGKWYWESNGDPAFEFFVSGTGNSFMRVIAIDDENSFTDSPILYWLDDGCINYTVNYLTSVFRLDYCILEDGSLGLMQGDNLIVSEEYLSSHPVMTTVDAYADIVGSWAPDLGIAGSVTGFQFNSDNTGYLHAVGDEDQYTYSFEWGWGEQPGYIYVTVLCGETHPGLDSRMLTLEVNEYSIYFDGTTYVRFSTADGAADGTETTGRNIVGSWHARNAGWPDLVFFDDGTGYLRYAPHVVDGFTYEYTGSAWNIQPETDQNSYNCFFNAEGLYVTGWGYYDRLSEDDYYGEYMKVSDGAVSADDILGEWYDPRGHRTFYINADGTVTGGWENGTWSIVDGNVIFSQDYLRYANGTMQRGGDPATGSQEPIENGYVWWDMERR
jgi:hypothetical protein